MSRLGWPSSRTAGASAAASTSFHPPTPHGGPLTNGLEFVGWLLQPIHLFPAKQGDWWWCIMCVVGWGGYHFHVHCFSINIPKYYIAKVVEISASRESYS